MFFFWCGWPWGVEDWNGCYVTPVTLASENMKRPLLFSDRLRALMDARALSQAKLARAAGLSHVAVGNYLKGRVPDLAAATKLAQFFGVSVEQLIHGTSDPQPISAIAKAVADATPGTPEEKQAVLERATKTLATNDTALAVLFDELAACRALLTSTRADMDAISLRIDNIFAAAKKLR